MVPPVDYDKSMILNKGTKKTINIPHTSAREAKLISTATSHMMTACGQLNNSLPFSPRSRVQISNPSWVHEHGFCGLTPQALHRRHFFSCEKSINRAGRPPMRVQSYLGQLDQKAILRWSFISRKGLRNKGRQHEESCQKRMDASLIFGASNVCAQWIGIRRDKYGGAYCYAIVSCIEHTWLFCKVNIQLEVYPPLRPIAQGLNIFD